MKNERKRVREAMDRRLSSLQADPARRERIFERIEKESEPIMKRKMTVAVVFVLVAVLALGGVALGMGLNLFELFGQEDERLREIAPQAVLTTQQPVSVETEELGVSNARIDSAYFDGQTLIVGYVMENSSQMEAYTPTGEELQQMEKMTDAMPVMIPLTASEEEAAVFRAYNSAVESGTPYGFVKRSLDESDHTRTVDGLDFQPLADRAQRMENGTLIQLREYDASEAADRDRLDIAIAVRQNEYYEYFDGKDVYTRSDCREIGQMTATVERAESGMALYTGEGEFEGIPVVVYVKASAVRASVSVMNVGKTSLEDNLAENCYPNLILTDEKGRELERGEEVFSEKEFTAELMGTGSLPESLTLTLWQATDGGQIPDGHEKVTIGLTKKSK